jgi:hypothetical protein
VSQRECRRVAPVHPNRQARSARRTPLCGPPLNEGMPFLVSPPSPSFREPRALTFGSVGGLRQTPLPLHAVPCGPMHYMPSGPLPPAFNGHPTHKAHRRSPSHDPTPAGPSLPVPDPPTPRGRREPGARLGRDHAPLPGQRGSFRATSSLSPSLARSYPGRANPAERRRAPWHRRWGLRHPPRRWRWRSGCRPPQAAGARASEASAAARSNTGTPLLRARRRYRQAPG